MLKLLFFFFLLLVGDNPSNWYLDLKNGSGSCGRGEPPKTPADATLTMESDNFFAMFSGNLP